MILVSCALVSFHTKKNGKLFSRLSGFLHNPSCIQSLLLGTRGCLELWLEACYSPTLLIIEDAREETYFSRVFLRKFISFDGDDVETFSPVESAMAQ